ncbi:MAG: hypothetical protein ABUM51_01135 [Bacteroidota bacterium]
MSKQTIPQQTPSDKNLASAVSPIPSTSGVSLPAVPVLQLAHNGKRTIAEVPELVENLTEMGVLATDEQRNLLIRILAMNRNFEEYDIIPILMGEAELGPDTAPKIEKKRELEGSSSDEKEPSDSDEYDFLSAAKTVETKSPPLRLKPSGAGTGRANKDRIEVEFPPRTQAVILWAGSALTDHRIGPLRDAYKKLYPGQPLRGQGEMDAEARELEEKIVFDGLRLNKFEIQQALEQESIHTEVIFTVCRKLLALGLEPVVIRPPDSSLIDPGAIQHLPWAPLGAKIDLPPTHNTILITVGHGSSAGETNIPSATLADFTKITGLLKTSGVESVVLYIPLQCYPQQAVDKGRSAGVSSVSINSRERSDDGEMKRWIEANLQQEIIQWALSKVKK